ncbi:MAG: hypothetical protein RLY85_622 [Bacteroidota bacterium]|jgi:hypothetical protein
MMIGGPNFFNQKLINMKRILFATFAASVILAGCTKDFERINTNPLAASPASFDANYFLSNAQNTYKEAIGGYAGPILFQAGWVQILSSTSSGGANYYSNMDKYVQSSNTNSYTANSWNSCFRAAGLAQQIVKDFGKDATKANVVSAAIVVKALSFLYAADVYGDLPYTEALQGETGLSQPTYDAQQTVLKGLLTELDGALTKFDAAKAKPSADLFYGGDVAKWKKLGYSVMLRIAMRFTKRDAAFAKSWAEKAYTGGVMMSSADDCFLKGNIANGYTNPNSRALDIPADFYSVRWSEKLINYLKSSNDPRLGAVAEVPQAGLAANNQIGLAGINDPAVQLGQPNGYDLNAGATDITKAPGYPGGTGSGGDLTPVGKYSRPRSSVYINRESPLFIMTAAETSLLLAEAAARGWSVGASAAAHYANGVKAGTQSLATFSATAAVPTAAVDAFLTAKPLDVSSQAASLKQINEEYWATNGLLMNFAEAWSNWRRSGHPALTPVNYTGNFSGGAIPRRQIYPTGEASVNGAGYAKGVAGLSAGDVWNSRVWWDN